MDKCHAKLSKTQNNSGSNLYIKYVMHFSVTFNNFAIMTKMSKVVKLFNMLSHNRNLLISPKFVLM